MHITLIEPNLSGHHKVYLLSFIHALKSLGHSVVVYSMLTECEVEHRQLLFTFNRHLPSNFLIKKVMVGVNCLISILNLWRVRQQILGKTDLVFFCCIDDYLNDLIPLWIFDILFPISYSGLLLSPRNRKTYFSLDRRNVLKSKNCKSIGVLDEFCEKDLSKFCANIIQFPDFSDEAKPNLRYSLAVDIKRKASGRKIVSLLGAISIRKGIYTFVGAAKELPEDQFYFVIAGKSYLESREERFIEEDFATRTNCCYYNSNIPSESDFNMLISISDIVYAAYVNFSQSSNMLAKASLFRKPLIVSRGAYMEEVVNKYSLGIAIEQDSIKECIHAISYYSNHQYDYRGCELYLSKNSIDNLNISFEKALRINTNL